MTTRTAVGRRLAGVVVAASIVVATGQAQGSSAAQGPDGYWPTHGWRASSPEAQGMDSRTLARAFQFVRDSAVPIHSLVIVRNGRVVLDASFYPYQAGQPHDMASSTKSVTTTLIGMAIGEHRLSGVGQLVLPLFPGVAVSATDIRKPSLTVEHLLTMTGGYDCTYEHGEARLDSMQRSPNWVRYMLDLPIITEPGRTWAYCSPGMHLLSGIVSKVTGMSALDYAKAALFTPLGITDAAWPADPQGVSHGWGDLHLAPRDMAKLGYLWLQHGQWEGRQIVPADWMDAATRPFIKVGGEQSYGYGLWVYPDRKPPIFEALGRGGQRISVIPAWHLVVVMAGGGYEPGDIGKFIGEAVKADGPIPENADGAAALASAVAAASQPPPSRAVPAAPPVARDIAGRRYALGDNRLDLKALTLTFPQASEAILRIERTDGRVEERRVGLDDVPRLSGDGRFGLPVALTGKWENERTFVFLYDEVANINAYRFALTFAGKDVAVKVSERTGLVETEFRGRQ